jgi:ribokinase
VSAETLAGLIDTELHALCRCLTVPTVVLTLGARGVFVSHAEDDLRGDASVCYRIEAEAVTPIDSTGAGDAFNGALAAALATKASAPFRDAVRAANRVAALSTESPGASTAIPTRAEVLNRFGA